MKKILILLLFIAAYSTATNAQEQNYKSLELKVDSLQQQLDKLNYDYHYLECTYKLDRLNINLNVFLNSLRNTVDRLLIAIYHDRAYDANLYRMNKMEYDSFADLLDDYKTQASILKWSCATMSESIGFNDSDIKLLDSNLKAIGAAINSAEITLENYKKYIAVYKDL